ncbi:MAG TPA: SelB C-terminal domain-containing protein [Ornithinicoccus sp.]|nr:SelB C-terminal domain-containing protein [Ornithinicoccus sp.]
MKRVFATAGHVDHGKSTLVRALTGRDPDRLAEEKARRLTIELGFAWTRLPSGADVAIVDVPGHQRFVGTTLSGLGPAPAVVFVVAADQGWQQQSSEHLAAVRALGISEGLLVVTRTDLADDSRREATRDAAQSHLAAAGLDVPAVAVSAITGDGMDALRTALDELAARLPAPDPDAPVRLWCDRSFTVPGAGTVTTGTLGAGTLRTGDHLSLLAAANPQDVVVRGLQSEDVPRDVVQPVSRVAVNLRRVGADDVVRGSVLVSPGRFALAEVVDVRLEPVEFDGPVGSATEGHAQTAKPPEQAVLHVGTAALPSRVRPLGVAHARVTTNRTLPWRVGDRAILRDPASRRLWALRVLDVDPLPLHRRGAAARRASALEDALPEGVSSGVDIASLADLRVRSRGAELPPTLSRLGLADPTSAVRIGQWWVDEQLVDQCATRLGEQFRDHHRARPLSHGIPLAEAVRALELPDHLRPTHAGGSLAADVPALGPDLVKHVAPSAGLAIEEGRVQLPGESGLGVAEAAVAVVEERLSSNPFAAPERDELRALGLGPVEIAAAARTGRLLRLADDILLLPDAPARAMRELAALEQPFTLSAARQALGTTRRVAVPLLEHLDARGWTRRLDGQLRRVVR